MAAIDLFPGFDDARIAIDGVRLRVRTRRVPGRPPLLLLHGHPQTHAIWHKVAPALAGHFSIVAPDLRGYGDSDKPEGGDEHQEYSKRQLALDNLQLMRHFGYSRFAVLAHDRGARVAHRLAADHSEAVARMVLLDIAPTLAMYEQTSMEFARAYWHWFFLIQREPLPEILLGANPAAYVKSLIGGRFATEAERAAAFTPEAMAEYVRCIRLPGTVHAICEDYRASATIDLEHDRADREAGRMLEMPILALWGANGILERCFKPIDEWRRVALDLRGEKLPCGHYIPEEAPEALLTKALPFLEESR
jgi:haloacetate dehalogenase